MVVLDTAEVPHQPGNRVGLPVGPPSKDLVIGTMKDSSTSWRTRSNASARISRTVSMRALCPSGAAVDES